MPTNTLKQLAMATILMTTVMTASALTTSAFTFADQNLQGMLVHNQPPQLIQPAEATESASPAQLHVGLSGPGTRLVLPWFLADLVDVVDRQASPQDFAKKLRDGI